MSVNITAQWTVDQLSAFVVNHTVVTDSTVCLFLCVRSFENIGNKIAF